MADESAAVAMAAATAEPTINPAVNAEGNARSARLRALGEAAIANPNDPAYLEAVILEMGGDINSPEVALVRGLVEGVKTGVLSSKQALETLTAQTAQVQQQVAQPAQPTEAVALAAATGGTAVAAASATTAATTEEAPAILSIDPRQREAEALAKLGIEQNSTGVGMGLGKAG